MLTRSLKASLETSFLNIQERIDPNQFCALKGLSTTHALVDILHNFHNGNGASVATDIHVRPLSSNHTTINPIQRLGS